MNVISTVDGSIMKRQKMVQKRIKCQHRKEFKNERVKIFENPEVQPAKIFFLSLKEQNARLWDY